MKERIAHYRIERPLGQGGMGVVYAARDEKLDRPVAIKTILSAPDATSLKRFWREARAAASVNHPNVCQIYEVGEAEGVPFIAMELLEGEPLSARLLRGAIPLPEAVDTALSMLAALECMHARGVVHRDLKPSNVFLTPHGVKLLDFGLAHAAPAGDQGETASVLTQPGTILGTPRYMSPEQVRGQPAGPRSDIFSLSAILFEMLSATPASPGRTAAEVFHATLYEQPPALAGSPSIAAVDLVIRRGLAKKAEDRHATAAAMAEALRATRTALDDGEAPRVRPMTRLIVLPFRMLRPDPETDFLAWSVPDAVTSALSGLQSLVVRSSLVAARLVGETLDLARVAAEADVDVVLTGSLLRAGDQIRAATQLMEAPGGALIWSHSSTSTLKNVFQLQDDLVRRIVDSLSLPLTAREHRLLRHDVPASASAYEFYLRANQLARDSPGWELARQLYERCLEEDPGYAPAWARLGRVCRLLAKYSAADSAANLQRAEVAFRRALETNPDLSLAHNLFAQFEVEAGRPRDALVRLLERAKTGSADPELFSGLVHVCRYCGLLDASLAAHHHARRLDPGARTSVSYTHWMRGDYEQAAEQDIDDTPFVRNYALGTAGRVEEAIAGCRDIEGRAPLGGARDIAQALRGGLEGDGPAVRQAAERLAAAGFHDPEGVYFLARSLARTGQRAEALRLLGRTVEGGFFCTPALRRDPWLDPLRGDPGFERILARAQALHDEAAAAYAASGGPQVLGVAE